MTTGSSLVWSGHTSLHTQPKPKWHRLPGRHNGVVPEKGTPRWAQWHSQSDIMCQQHLQRGECSRQQWSTRRLVHRVRGLEIIPTNFPHQIVLSVTILASMKEKLLAEFPDTLSDNLSPVPMKTATTCTSAWTLIQCRTKNNNSYNPLTSRRTDVGKKTTFSSSFLLSF